MKPKCLICQKILSKYSAKHCKSHRPISIKTRKLLGKIHKGNTYGFKKGQTPWNKGIPAFWIQGNKNPNWGKFGPNHPKWTGRTLLTKAIRACQPYVSWRISIFKRDNWTCQICNARSAVGKKVYLEADHYPIQFASILREYRIKTFEQAIDCKPLWEAKGRTLCRGCHPRPGKLLKKGC